MEVFLNMNFLFGDQTAQMGMLKTQEGLPWGRDPEGTGAGYHRLLCNAHIHLTKTTEVCLAFQDHDDIFPSSPVIGFRVLR